MLSKVIPFRKKVDAGGWRSDEFAECYRVVELLARSGLPVSIDSGVTDEGEPWAIVLREDSGDVLLHLARLDGKFVVISAAGPFAQRGDSLRAVLDTAIRTGGLAMLTRHSATANSDILRLHPATLIAAFIAGAWAHTQTSQAELMEASARREGGGADASRIEEVRMAGFAALPPSAVLAAAAASFAAVAVALRVTQVDPILEMTPDDFVQAALGLVAEMEGKAHIGAAPMELANLELKQDGTLTPSATLSEPTLSGAAPDDALTLVRIETKAMFMPMPAPGVGDVARFFVQQQDGFQSLSIARGAADGYFLANGPPRGLADFEPMPTWVLLVDTLPSAKEQAPATRPAIETPTPFRSILGVELQPTRGEGTPVIKAMLPTVVGETRPLLAPEDALAMIYKSAAQILNLDSATTPKGAETNGSFVKDKNTGSTVELTLASTAAPVDAPNMPSSTQSSTATLVTPQVVPGNPDANGGSRPLTVAVPSAPPSNAQLILEFTNGTEHIVRIDRSGLASPLGNLETGDAHKVLIFDAPWLAVKSFMLMPGVMMVEDDLLGGVNRAGIEMTGSSVLLDLGGGLSLTLLGVVDLGLI